MPQTLEAVQLTEYASAQFDPAIEKRIDREKGIIYGVKFLGERSQNPPPRNNVYPRSTRDKAVSVLEGSRVNIDHPKRGQEKETRSYADGFGVARSLVSRDDGLFGNCHYNPKHPLAEQVAWDVENCSDGLGFSIVANGEGYRNTAGEFIVESIVEAKSIDLVSRPATTRGLFESRTDQPMKKRIRQLLREAVQSATRKRALPLFEQEVPAEVLDAEVEAPAEPAPEEPQPSEEDRMKEAFRSMVIAAFDDPSLDTKATLARIKEILTAQEKLMAGGEAPSEPSEPSDMPAEESLRGEVTRLRRLVEARQLCDREGVTCNGVLERALQTARDQGEMLTLIREHKEAIGGQQQRNGGGPISRTPTPPRNGNQPELKTREQFVEACFGEE